MTSDADATFSGDVPSAYESFMVPIMFEPYAADLAGRLADLTSGDVLELAAGTGVATRALATSLPPSVALTATDLSQAMLDRAMQIGTARPVTFRRADAQSLPFGDGSFDAVVCQFGVMFFPDKGAAFAEARRVLRPGGRLVFSTWDGLGTNGFPATVHDAVTGLGLGEAVEFMGRIPHGYHDVDQVRADVRAGGFSGEAEVEVVTFTSRAPTADSVAKAICLGTPLYDQLRARGPSVVDAAVRASAAAVERRYGATDLSTPMTAFLVTVRKGASG